MCRLTSNQGGSHALKTTDHVSSKTVHISTSREAKGLHETLVKSGLHPNEGSYQQDIYR